MQRSSTYIADLVNAMVEAYPQATGQNQLVTMLAGISIDFFRYATRSDNFETTLTSILVTQNQKKEGLDNFLEILRRDARPVVLSFFEKSDQAFPAIDPKKEIYVSSQNASEQTESGQFAKLTRRDIEITSRRLRRVQAYKDIHDTLHDIQKECHDLMVLEFFKISDDSFEPLQDYYDTYCLYLARLRKISEAEYIEKEEFAWIERRMPLIAREWKAGLQEKDIRKIAKAEMQLRGALSNLNQVNTLLHRSAADMLPGLIGTLEALTPDISKRDEAAAIDFQERLVRLRQLSAEFDPLVERHHRWQEVDNEIRRIAEFVPDVLDELMASWPLFDELLKLLEEPSEVWWQPLLERHQSLKTALDGSDADVINKQFRRYRKMTGEVFYIVDKRLKAQCEQLPKLASDLTSLWDRA
jgi:hypothetical protein